MTSPTRPSVPLLLRYRKIEEGKTTPELASSVTSKPPFSLNSLFFSSVSPAAPSSCLSKPTTDSHMKVIMALNRRLILDPESITTKLEKELRNAETHLHDADNPRWTKSESQVKDYHKSALSSPQTEPLEDSGIGFTTGSRTTMEDEAVATLIKINSAQVPLFAVFDGHGGVSGAKFLKEQLPTHLERSLKTKMYEALYETSDVAVFNALKLPFATLGELYRKDASRFVKNAGSTAVGSLIYEGDLWTFNLGDSRAMLSINGRAICLSQDARLSQTKHQTSTIKRNGIIVKDFTGYRQGFETPRIQIGNRLLEPARAFGHAEDSGVNPRCKITRVSLETLICKNSDWREGSFLLLATDGFWEGVSSTQAALACQTLAKAKKTPKEIAQALTERAFEVNKPYSDNITLIVVDLFQWLKKAEGDDFTACF